MMTDECLLMDGLLLIVDCAAATALLTLLWRDQKYKETFETMIMINTLQLNMNEFSNSDI